MKFLEHLPCPGTVLGGLRGHNSERDGTQPGFVDRSVHRSESQCCHFCVTLDKSFSLSERPRFCLPDEDGAPRLTGPRE